VLISKLVHVARREFADELDKRKSLTDQERADIEKMFEFAITEAVVDALDWCIRELFDFEKDKVVRGSEWRDQG